MDTPTDDEQHKDDVVGNEVTSTNGDDGAETTDDDDQSQDGEGENVNELLQKTLQKMEKKELNLLDKGQFDEFEKTDGDSLATATGKNKGPTALLILAAKDNHEWSRVHKDQMEPLVKHLLWHKDCRLRARNNSGRTAMHLAIEHRNEDMVRWMCEHHKIESVIADKLETIGNCVHLGIKKKVGCLNLLVEKASAGALAAKDGDGNTPLHLAVEYKRCKQGQLEIIKQMVEKGDREIRKSDQGDFNNKGHSPYLHHLETARGAKKKEEKRKPKMGETQNTRQTKEYNVGMRHQVDATDNGAPGTPAPGQTSVRRPSPSSRKQAESGEAVAGASSSKANEDPAGEVQSFLKMHYLRSRSHDQALKILYGDDPTSVRRHLYFDLLGKDYRTTEEVDRLLSRLKFEDILQYISIPELKIEADAMEANGSGDGNGGDPPEKKKQRRRDNPKGSGRHDLCFVFDRLRGKGVETILKVIVDDLVSPAHSDEAIETVLKGFGVEIWDWMRIDLCSEVIQRAAPHVREVNLYWSGNNAVLRGWAEEGGLKELKELQTVHLHTQQGLETKARMNENVRIFCQKLKERCPDVKVFTQSLVVQVGSRGKTVVHTEQQGFEGSKHEWIDCMKEFRKLVWDAQNAYDRINESQKVSSQIKEPIKVALIDDGVDMMDLGFPVIDGRSFYTRDQRQNLNAPHYDSSRGHGTTMAKQIYLLCPWAELYVYRLEDHDSGGGARQISAGSAAQAIHEAVKAKVHIISMSWTIEASANGREEDDLQKLKKAIDAAVDAKILMFCSASDKGANTEDTYPSKTATQIFTIGAAKSSGATDSWIGNPAKVDFTLPGVMVEVDGNQSNQGPATGSSVATALAAGLAALVLYCAQVRIMVAGKDAKEKSDAKMDFEHLKRHHNMKKVLRNIGTTVESKNKYITVWETFGMKVFADKLKDSDPERLIDLVGGVGRTLCEKMR